MKSLLLIFLLIPCFLAQGQSKKFSFGLEYSPNVTNISNGSPFPDRPMSIGHNVFLKGEMSLNKHLSLTTGVGFLNTKHYEKLFLNGQLDISLIESHRSHEYLVIPVGFKYRFGQFYVQPEIGIAWNQANYVVQSSYLTNGAIITQKFEDNLIPDRYNKITLPAFLTIGSEFDLGTFSILFAIKGYYSFSDISNRTPWPEKYYGVGMMTGIKF